jgi:hypothetical protein
MKKGTNFYYKVELFGNEQLRNKPLTVFLCGTNFGKKKLNALSEHQ